jgi:enoyl-[acyl-carrier protein] reductase III
MTNEKPFADKIALVTGSRRGIGRSIALHFASLGANVVINFFRNRNSAEDVAEKVQKLGRDALVVKANVGEIDEINHLFREIEARYGGLDIFVSNAASGYNRPAMEQKPKGWDWTMNINARSFLFATQQAVPLMEKRGGGFIVAITSQGGDRVIPDYVVVGASKAALNALTRYLAVELAPKNIVVNAVSPGVVETDVLKHFAVMRKEGLLENIVENTPAGRMVTPEDVARVVAFLCSPESEMIRGEIITVDGGLALTMRNVVNFE